MLSTILKKIEAKYQIVVADFKTVEKKFLDQGENKDEVKKYLELFKKLRDKNKLSDQERNIDLWAKKPFKDFKKRLDELEKEKTNTEKRKGAVNTAKEVSGAKKIEEDDNWVIYEILTNEAAAELGQGTEWCIKHNPSKHWEDYSTENNIYYLISKNLPVKDRWAKIAFLIGKRGETSYWDALDREHSSVPKELKIPQFKYEKPSLWEYAGGDLDVRGLGLKSLEGAPNEVGGDFYCYENQLTSLEGAPKTVGGNFDCSENQLKSLKGAPKEVGGNFDCSENQLKSLEGAPEKVGGNFHCWDQKSGKKFTKEEVRAVCKVRGNVYV